MLLYSNITRFENFFLRFESHFIQFYYKICIIDNEIFLTLKLNNYENEIALIN